MKNNILYNGHVKILMYLTFFSLSFRFVDIAVLLSSILILIFLFNNINYKRELFSICIIIYYLLFILFGYDNYELGINKLINLCAIFCVTSLLFFYIGCLEHEKAINLMVAFSFMNFLYASSICVYSLYSGYLGYGNLYDFYSGREVNSPQYAMLILISVVFLFEFSSINVICKVSLLILGFSLSSLYLSSRASLLIFCLYFLMLTIRSGGVKSLILFIGICFLLYFSVDYILDNENFYIVNRLLNKGLESPRFNLSIYGLNNFMDYPFGGLKAQNAGTTYSGVWFHNVYFDIVRISGYLIMIIWMLFQFFTFINCVLYMYCYNLKYGFSLLLVFIFISIVYIQDLSFDGFYNIMVYLFFVFGFVLNINKSSYDGSN